MSNFSSEKALPIISVSLGMPIQQVETGSTAIVRFYNSVSREPSDDFHEDFPHQLHYVHPTLGFIIPNMEQVALSSSEGKITNISDRPLSRLLDINEAIQLCNVYTTIIDKAGWQREAARGANLYSFMPTRDFTSLDEVKNTFLDKTLIEPLEEVKVASWRNGADEIQISLDRKRYHGLPTDWVNEREYLLTLELLRHR